MDSPQSSKNPSFFYKNSGIIGGPYPLPDLISKLNKDSLVSVDGTTWKPVTEWPELAPYLQQISTSVVSSDLIRKITCRTCQKNIVVDLSKVAGEEVVVACPGCKQKYRIRRSATPAGKPASGPTSPTPNPQSAPPTPTVPPPVQPATQPGVRQSYDELYPKRKNYTWVYILVGAVVVAGLFFLFKSSDRRANDEADTGLTEVEAADSVATDAGVIPAEFNDVYSSILSVRSIDQRQLDALSLSDLNSYRNILLARHGYTFSDNRDAATYFRQQDWYSPTRNYLEATSDFSSIESSNFNLIDRTLGARQERLTSIVRSYFQDISDRTFDATKYFSSSISVYIKRKNLSPWEVNELMTEGYSEYLNPEYSFTDPIEFTLTGHQDGVDLITFPVFFRTLRQSRSEWQSCEIQLEWGLDQNMKIVSYKELALKNLKFSAVEAADSTQDEPE